MNTKRKKALALFMATLLTVTLLPSVFGEEGLTKRVLINVAQYKPVTAGSVHTDYPASNLVDGRRQDPSLVVPESYDGTEATGYADDWFAVDLLRRYQIEKIELYDRYSAPDEGGRQYFQILGANNEDFSDAEVLGEMGAQDDTVFPDNGPFTAELDGQRAFRYIKLQRTGDGYYGYSELKVYAHQTVTEVSRGKSAVASYSTVAGGFTYGPELAVNGTNASPADAWVTEGELQSYHFMTIDLEQAQPIGMIEIEDRAENLNIYTRQGNAVYGSNTTVPAETLMQSQEATEEMGYHKLTEIGEFNQYIGGEQGTEFPFPKLSDGIYQEGCDDREAYRYITFKKISPQLPAAVGEIRAYVVNPEVLSVTADSQAVYVHFSDEMDFETINTNTVTLCRRSDSSNTGASAEQYDAYTVRFDLSGLDKQQAYTVFVDQSVKNEKGTAMAESYQKNLDSLNQIAVSEISFHPSADGSGAPVTYLDGLETISAKTSVQSFMAGEREISLFLAQYGSDGKLIQSSVDCQTVGTEEMTLVTALSLNSTVKGSKLRAFVWDSTDDTCMPLCVPKELSGSQTEFYVSPLGNDGGRGTPADPFRSLDRAKQAVRENNDVMNSDITVYLMEGIHHLDDTFYLTEEDGGNNGNYVNYRAYPGTKPVISGGRRVEGWSLYDSERNIYQAEVPGLGSIPAIYVNGKAARRARSEDRIVPVSVYAEQSRPRGVVIPAEEADIYQNPQDIQLRYTRGWESTILNVESMEEDSGQIIIKLESPAFDIVTETDPDGQFEYYTFGITERNAFYIENALELLDTPEEFYYDKAGGILYYMAKAGEDMSTAEVYAPVLDRLVEVAGSSLANKVQNIRFEGITFAHATRADAGENYLGGQAQMKTPVAFPQSAYPLDNTMTGANIRVSAAENIDFTGDTFMGLSAVALGLYQGANNVTAEGNIFYNIGDSAVTIGMPSDDYMENLTDGRNVALFKNVSASSQERYYMACYANDGSLSRGWNIQPVDGSYLNAWWQVDLGQPYTIEEIRIGRREFDDGSAYDQEIARRNFEVLGSNDPDFGEYVVLASQGMEPFDNENGFRSEVTDPEKYRYVRVRKTVNEYFFLSELEVISHDDMTPVKEVCKNSTITNNYITRIGGYNYGAPGIQTYYTENAEISHNLIEEVPYSGICIGWGWTMARDSVTSKNNLVQNNRITDFAQKAYDAGGIYTLGQQPGSVISGNYISGQVNGYGAFYPDSGSADYTVENNVFEDVDVSYFMYTGGDRRNLTVRGNYSTPAGCETYGEDCTVTPPAIYLPWDVPAGAEEIISLSGLEKAYAGLPEQVPTTETALDVEEMYGNVIDEDNPTIDSILNPKFVKYYLDYRVEGAKTILESGRGIASAESCEALAEAIAEAEQVSDETPETGELPVAENHAYRKKIIQARLKLMDCVRAVVTSTQAQ